MESKTTSPITSQLKGMMVNRSLPCSRCGYDLKSLEANGNCPECGEPIRLTIIDIVDPASRRLPPIERPKVVGNALVGVAFFLLLSFVCAVLVLISRSPTTFPIPMSIRTMNDPVWICISSALALLSVLNLIPLMRLCRCGIIQGCRLGIVLTGSGLFSWAVLMGLSRWMLLGGVNYGTVPTLLFDTMLPVLALGTSFVGLRRLVPRLGQRSREFRLAQGSRQRMNDLLAALVIVVIGRTCISLSNH
ncbi:MAG: hypothetical protein QGF07_03865, partial [Phycisphaerales bacterium]|nr:hypothetical protein [Phycisphaerales bacterium]